MHYLLFYEVGEDYISRRASFREAHLGKVWQSHERGELLLAGALANPVDGAVLLFQGSSPHAAEAFAKADPYVMNGLVKRWYVREWSTVAGENAANPVRPQSISSKNEPATRANDNPSPAERGPILRMWRAHSTSEKAGAYIQHATGKVFPALRTIEGHRGVYLLRRSIQGVVELAVLTLWNSMEAVRRFAGRDPTKAVVEPAARELLTSFDEFVEHFEVVDCTIPGRGR